MTKVTIDGKEYCAETLLFEVKRLHNELIAAEKVHRMVLEDIKAEIEDVGADDYVEDEDGYIIDDYLLRSTVLDIIDKHIGGEQT